VQIILFHTLMLAAVFLLVRRAWKQPLTWSRLVRFSIYGLGCAMALSLLTGVFIEREAAGQRFAEALFFTGGTFLCLLASPFSRYSGVLGSAQTPEYRLNGERWASTTALLCGMAAILVGAYSLYYEPWHLTVKTYTVETDKVRHPFRIVVLADIQTDQFGDYERNMFQTVKQLDADLILFAGDYVQYPNGRMREGGTDFQAFLIEAGLEAPLGVIAIDGNHEQYRPNWRVMFDGTGIQTIPPNGTFSVVLRNIEDEIRLTLLPLSESQRPLVRLPDVEGRFHVLCGHDPSFAGGRPGADLLLAGHTHGGQVCIPGFGPIITLAKGLPRHLGKGRSDRNGSTLIISNGVGHERGFAPRIRFCSPPQIVVVDVVPISK